MMMMMINTSISESKRAKVKVAIAVENRNIYTFADTTFCCHEWEKKVSKCGHSHCHNRFLASHFSLLTLQCYVNNPMAALTRFQGWYHCSSQALGARNPETSKRKLKQE
ncbi:uncharacterized protein DS421_13g433940 [Arachis hypogaea]|nr:uncharacterized protein DS421_13g433940 [Arachis hypogaea]